MSEAQTYILTFVMSETQTYILTFVMSETQTYILTFVKLNAPDVLWQGHENT